MSRRRSASLERLQSGLYRVRARIDGRLVTLGTGLTEAAARELADGVSHVRAGGAIPSLDLADYGVAALERRELRGVRGVDAERWTWRAHVAEDALGTLPVSTVRRRDVVEWLDRLRAKRLAAKTLRNCLTLLRGVLADAVDREHLEQNPARDVRIPRSESTTRTEDLAGVLLPNEQRRLVEAAPAAHRAAVLFAILTGLRLSEQWWLRWSDVELELGHIVVRTSRHGLATKAGRPRRVPLTPPVRELLIRLLEERSQSPRPSEWVFPSRWGGRRKESKHPERFAEWVRAAGIDRRIRWHDLRHTCATSLLAGWWGPAWRLEEVQRYLGHSSVTITERYARLVDEAAFARLAATVAAGALAGSSTSVPPFQAPKPKKAQK